MSADLAQEPVHDFSSLDLKKKFENNGESGTFALGYLYGYTENACEVCL